MVGYQNAVMRACRPLLPLLAFAALMSACVARAPRALMPPEPATDSLASQVTMEIWRYHAALGRLRDTIAMSNRPTRACSSPLFTVDRCLTANSFREDSASILRALVHADTFALRLAALRARVGAHPRLDETLVFAYAWRRRPEALAIPLTGCDAADWWCDALRGLAAHRVGATVTAEQHFARVLAALPPAEQCRWHMLALLPRASCAHASPAQDSLRWWLSDPLWLEPGNDRWTEHLSRHVLFRIFERHEQLLQQAHLRPQQSKSMDDWSADLSLTRALRYGFLAGFVWYDIDRPRLLRTQSGGAQVRDLVGPKYEFSPVDPLRYAEVSRSDTTRLVPWPAPVHGEIFTCVKEDCLTRPGAEIMVWQTVLTSGGRIRRMKQEGVGVNESYGRSQHFDRVREFQVVTLPHGGDRTLYAAYPVRRVASPGLMGAAFSRSPTDSIVRLLASDHRGDVVRVTGRLPAEGGVLSLEAVSNPSQVWRHRFYLPADSVRDVSPVVLLSEDVSSGHDASSPAPRATGDIALPTALPLDRLLPRTWLFPTERFELYWEVSDSTYAGTVALEFQRSDQSAWQQVTGLFRGGADGQRVRVEPGALPPIVRDGRRVGFALPFTLSGLAPGAYTVRGIAIDPQTGAERAGQATAFEVRANR